MKTILILASNPDRDLDLGYEIHALKDIIEDTEKLQKFNVIIDNAISPSNIQRLLLEHKPRIVHFCGHGSGENGLVFIDAAGEKQQVSTKALSNLFREFEDTVECVLLNACYSEIQANAIARHVNYAIGMNQAITDDAAIFFAKGFYRALESGKKIQQCFKLGKNAIELELSRLSGQPRKLEVLDDREYSPIPEYLKPTIKIRSQLTLFSEDTARQKYIQDNQNDFNLGQKQQTNISQKEYRLRKILLNKVRDSWIKGVLENSLHTKALLELKIQGRPDLVQNPFSKYQELPVDPNSSYEWLHATDVFEQMGDGRTLLILGEPGSGKTIALLKLAKRFIKKTDNNLSLPLPVVFNLSSWATKRQPIAEWLKIELKEKYQVSKSLAEDWVDREQLLLLLDGLDEVKQEYRNDCAIAINEFLNSHGSTEIVICSRFIEYQSLSEKLQLRSAIYIQSLTLEHIDWYLKDTGNLLSGLKTLLKNDAEIEEFAKTPLILSIMSLTYQNYSSEEVLKQLSSPENRYKNLFDSYIERMFQRRASQIYDSQQTKKWLNIIAKNMRSESLFLIEKMQPNWFQNKTETIAYRIANFILGAIVFGLPYGVINGCVNGLSNGIIGGIIASFNSKIILFEQISWSWERAKNIIIHKALNWLKLSIKFWFVFVSIGLIFLVLGKFELLMVILFSGLLLFTMFYFLPIEMLNSGFKNSEVKQRTFPNQGIWSSSKNSLKIGSISALMFVLIGFILVFLLQLTEEYDGSILKGALNIAITYTVVFGLINGGNTCIRHFNLRLILSCQNRIPWNYARFLDRATDNLFLQKVGGGYIFIHRMLMEHFAGMDREIYSESIPIMSQPASRTISEVNSRTKVVSNHIVASQPNNLVENYLVCSSCEHRNPITGKFCTNCGCSLTN